MRTAWKKMSVCTSTYAYQFKLLPSRNCNYLQSCTANCTSPQLLLSFFIHTGCLDYLWHFVSINMTASFDFDTELLHAKNCLSQHQRRHKRRLTTTWQPHRRGSAINTVATQLRAQYILAAAGGEPGHMPSMHVAILPWTAVIGSESKWRRWKVICEQRQWRSSALMIVTQR